MHHSHLSAVCCWVLAFCSLSAIIDNQIFCVHGGLSPTINTLDQVGGVSTAAPAQRRQQQQAGRHASGAGCPVPDPVVLLQVLGLQLRLSGIHSAQYKAVFIVLVDSLICHD